MFFKTLNIATNGQIYFTINRERLKKRIVILKKDSNNDFFNQKNLKKHVAGDLKSSLLYKKKFLNIWNIAKWQGDRF